MQLAVHPISTRAGLETVPVSPTSNLMPLTYYCTACLTERSKKAQGEGEVNQDPPAGIWEAETSSGCKQQREQLPGARYERSARGKG